MSALSPSTPGLNPASGSAFPEILNRVLAIQQHQSQVHAALEQVKFEAEQSLFSKRHTAPEHRAIEKLQEAADALHFIRSHLQETNRFAPAALGTPSPQSVTHLLA